MELAENFFSRKSVIARKRSDTPFFWAKRPLPPPRKNCLSSEANIGLFVQNFNNGSTSQLRSIAWIISDSLRIKMPKRSVDAIIFGINLMTYQNWGGDDMTVVPKQGLWRGKETKLKGEWIGSCQVTPVKNCSTLVLTLELVTSTLHHTLELVTIIQHIIERRGNILLNQNNINMLMHYIKEDNNNYKFNRWWGQVRGEEALCCQFKAGWGQVRGDEACCAVNSKWKLTKNLFLVGSFLTCWLADPFCQNLLLLINDLEDGGEASRKGKWGIFLEGQWFF